MLRFVLCAFRVSSVLPWRGSGPAPEDAVEMGEVRKSALETNLGDDLFGVDEKCFRLFHPVPLRIFHESLTGCLLEYRCEMARGQPSFLGHFADTQAVSKVVFNVLAGEDDFRAFKAVGHDPQCQTHPSQVFYEERQQFDGGVYLFRFQIRCMIVGFAQRLLRYRQSVELAQDFTEAPLPGR